MTEIPIADLIKRLEKVRKDYGDIYVRVDVFPICFDDYNTNRIVTMITKEQQ